MIKKCVECIFTQFPNLYRDYYKLKNKLRLVVEKRIKELNPVKFDKICLNGKVADCFFSIFIKLKKKGIVRKRIVDFEITRITLSCNIVDSIDIRIKHIEETSYPHPTLVLSFNYAVSTILSHYIEYILKEKEEDWKEIISIIYKYANEDVKKELLEKIKKIDKDKYIELVSEVI